MNEAGIGVVLTSIHHVTLDYFARVGMLHHPPHHECRSFTREINEWRNRGTLRSSSAPQLVQKLTMYVRTWWRS